MSTVALGISFGLAAAICQSAAYLQSRHFIGLETGGQRRLLLLGHVIQGVVGLALLPLLWPANMPAFRQYAFPLFMDAGGYLIGQAFLFTALRQVEASRVAPFLSAKVVILAGLTWWLLGQALSGWQWSAVGLAMVAAWLLNWTGEKLPTRPLGAIVVTVVGYSISDFYIRELIIHLAPVPPLRAAMVGVALSYAVCGVAVLPLWFRVGRIQRADIGRALPYALTWLVSMALLYACFALVGVVLDGIIQSTRGLISILLAPVMARTEEYAHLETAHPVRTVLCRAGVALLMTLAVALYIW
jgi:drug/metabolite transporter (DMT)-like permease